jgi:hypothetical protein
MEDYIAFWKGPGGQKLGQAMTGAFDQIFVDISRELGRAMAEQLQGDDI